MSCQAEGLQVHCSDDRTITYTCVNGAGGGDCSSAGGGAWNSDRSYTCAPNGTFDFPQNGLCSRTEGTFTAPPTLPSTPLTAAPTARSVLISNLFDDGALNSGSPYFQAIRLYNPTDEPVLLNSLELRVHFDPSDTYNPNREPWTVDLGNTAAAQQGQGTIAPLAHLLLCWRSPSVGNDNAVCFPSAFTCDYGIDGASGTFARFEYIGRTTRIELFGDGGLLDTIGSTGDDYHDVIDICGQPLPNSPFLLSRERWVTTGQPNWRDGRTPDEDCEWSVIEGHPAFVEPTPRCLPPGHTCDCTAEQSDRDWSMITAEIPPRVTFLGLANWDQRCGEQDDAAQDVAMNEACATDYGNHPGARAATAVELLERVIVDLPDRSTVGREIVLAMPEPPACIALRMRHPSNDCRAVDASNSMIGGFQGHRNAVHRYSAWPSNCTDGRRQQDEPDGWDESGNNAAALCVAVYTAPPSPVQTDPCPECSPACPASHPYNIVNSTRNDHICFVTRGGSNDGAACDRWCMLPEHAGDHELRSCPGNICASPCSELHGATSCPSDRCNWDADNAVCLPTTSSISTPTAAAPATTHPTTAAPTTAAPVSNQPTAPTSVSPSTQSTVPTTLSIASSPSLITTADSPLATTTATTVTTAADVKIGLTSATQATATTRSDLTSDGSDTSDNAASSETPASSELPMWALGIICMCGLALVVVACLCCSQRHSRSRLKPATPVVDNPVYTEFSAESKHVSAGSANSHSHNRCQPLPDKGASRSTYGVATALTVKHQGAPTSQLTYAELPVSVSRRPVHLQLADHAYASDADRVGVHRVDQWLDTKSATWESTEDALLTGGAVAGNYCLHREQGIIVLVLLLKSREVAHFRLTTDAQGMLFVGDQPGVTAPQSFVTIHDLLAWYAKRPLHPRAPLLTGCVAPPPATEVPSTSSAINHSSSINKASIPQIYLNPATAGHVVLRELEQYEIPADLRGTDEAGYATGCLQTTA